MYRYPFIYNPNLRRGDTIIQYHGILGLGPKSILWNYWDSASIGSTTLVLGAHWKCLEKSSFHLTFDFQHGIPCTVNDESYQLWYKPHDPYTYLPSTIYPNLSEIHVQQNQNHKNHKKDIILQLQSTDITTYIPGGMKEILLKRQLKGNPNIILGEQITRQFVSYIHPGFKTYDIAPGYSMFNGGKADSIFNSTSVILIIILLSLWWILVFTERHSNPLVKKACNQLENHSYLVIIIIVYLMVDAVKCEQWMVYHLDAIGGKAAFTVLMVFFYIQIIVGILVSWTNGPFLIRRCFIETAFIIAFWVVESKYHETLYHQLLLITLFSIYTTIRIMAFVHAYTMQKSWIFLSIYAVLSIIITIVYTYIPMLHRFQYGYPNIDTMIIYLFTIFVGLPTIFVFMKIQSENMQYWYKNNVKI
jgi:hypothetical protein